jgi:hypothetical protein
MDWRGKISVVLSAVVLALIAYFVFKLVVALIIFFVAVAVGLWIVSRLRNWSGRTPPQR